MHPLTLLLCELTTAVTISLGNPGIYEVTFPLVFPHSHSPVLRFPPCHTGQQRGNKPRAPHGSNLSLPLRGKDRKSQATRLVPQLTLKQRQDAPKAGRGTAWAHFHTKEHEVWDSCCLCLPNKTSCVTLEARSFQILKDPHGTGY